MEDTAPHCAPVEADDGGVGPEEGVAGTGGPHDVPLDVEDGDAQGAGDDAELEDRRRPPPPDQKDRRRRLAAPGGAAL